MPDDLLQRAREGDREAFAALVEPHRGELQLHCYRMLGSLQDAEDALQETLLSAWIGLSGFEGRSSVRTWLYRIATNRCLNVLRSSSRRPVSAVRLPVPEQERRERGAQRERVKCGDDDRNGDGDRELLIEPSSDPRHEDRRNEDRRENDGNSDNGRRHLLHCPDGGLFRREALFDMALHRLDHDDRVVHHQADRKHQTEQ